MLLCGIQYQSQGWLGTKHTAIAANLVNYFEELQAGHPCVGPALPLACGSPQLRSAGQFASGLTIKQLPACAERLANVEDGPDMTVRVEDTKCVQLHSHCALPFSPSLPILGNKFSELQPGRQIFRITAVICISHPAHYHACQKQILLWQGAGLTMTLCCWLGSGTCILRAPPMAGWGTSPSPPARIQAPLERWLMRGADASTYIARLQKSRCRASYEDCDNEECDRWRGVTEGN